MIASRKTYKGKNRLLLWGTILLLLLAVKFAFYPAWLQYASCKTLENTILLSKSIPQQQMIVERKERQVDKVILPYDEKDTTAQASLLQQVSSYCLENNTVLNEYPRSLKNYEEDYVVETNIFRVQGRFAKLLELVYELEQKGKGRVVSVAFDLRKEYKLKKNILTASIYVQNVRRTHAKIVSK